MPLGPDRTVLSGQAQGQALGGPGTALLCGTGSLPGARPGPAATPSSQQGLGVKVGLGVLSTCAEQASPGGGASPAARNVLAWDPSRCLSRARPGRCPWVERGTRLDHVQPETFLEPGRSSLGHARPPPFQNVPSSSTCACAHVVTGGQPRHRGPSHHWVPSFTPALCQLCAPQHPCPRPAPPPCPAQTLCTCTVFLLWGRRALSFPHISAALQQVLGDLTLLHSGRELLLPTLPTERCGSSTDQGTASPQDFSAATWHFKAATLLRLKETACFGWESDWPLSRGASSLPGLSTAGPGFREHKAGVEIRG